MTKHLADHRKATTGARVKQFLRLSRRRAETWHRPHTASGKGRLAQFLRIARGRST